VEGFRRIKSGRTVLLRHPLFYSCPDQIMEFKINTPISPIKDMVVSIRVHEKKVCFIERLKNSLNIQKAVSLTCDINTLPAPTANTSNSGDT
jgi:hypothetical protein